MPMKDSQKGYYHRQNSRACGILQLIQANVVYPLMGIGMYFLLINVYANSPQPMIIYIGIVSLSVCVIIGNLAGFLNIRKNMDFEFSLDENGVSCRVPSKFEGLFYQITFNDIESVVIQSDSEGFSYYIKTKQNDRLRIPEGYGNKIPKILQVFEDLGVVVERSL